MTILSTFGGTSGVDTGDIGHSLRFRGAQYLNRTFGTPTNQLIWTLAPFAKLGKTGVGQVLFAGGTSATTTTRVEINADGTLSIKSYVSNVLQWSATTPSLYRDPTGHIALLLAFDSTQATQANRLKIYNNGSEVVFNTSNLPSQNYAEKINSAIQHTFGVEAPSYGYFDGYLSRVCFVDGQALTPSSFGYFNTEINEWVSKSQSAVKAVVDAGGTNSFMLDFDDGTSLTTLGYDKSSKGNNWTLNNFSLTAGTSYDWMLDVPGNSFATLNPLNPSSATLSNGNLKGTHAASGNPTILGSIGFAADTSKFAWKFTPGFSTTYIFGIYRLSDGTTYSLSQSLTAGTTSEFRIDNGYVTFYPNGSLSGTTFSGVTGTVVPYFYAASASAYEEVDFGQQGYTPPTGFKALCQRNLPDPAILNPEKHFDVYTRAGTGASYTKTGMQFPPDLAWIKSRSNAYDHHLFDVIRGANKPLYSDLTSAEVTQTQALMSFNSDGYTLGTSSDSAINNSGGGQTFVDWLWKAGGAPVTNNAGSISSQVSANVTAGFSIVTATLSAANGTIGHGLGRAPGMVIGFRRNAAGTSHPVYHSGLASAANVVYLDTTAAQAASATTWNSTAPTSTVFSVGTGLTGDWVFYCFAEIAGYSKIFSYTGNGSADGPFVYCGFKPKYVLVKSSTAIDDWRVYDAARPGYNVIGGDLRANSVVAEATAAEIDFTADGFKLRVATTPNAAQTYIYYAIADVAGKYSLGR